MADATVEIFLTFSRTILRRPVGGSTTTLRKKYQTVFGVTPELTVTLWEAVLSQALEEQIGGISPEKQHLLWALMLLKLYSPEEVLATMANVSRNTFRTHAWNVILLLDRVANKKARGKYK